MTYKENITAILECYFSGFKKEIIDSACNRILKQEPKTGHWIDHQEGRWIYAKCSECGIVHNTPSSYCPSCGAKMTEGS